MSSCKKDAPYNPDDHITYEHWYKVDQRTHDTLYSVYLPSAFTPTNHDGINDVFYGRGYFKLKKFSVYDRQGELIFGTFDPNMHWNGRMNASGDFVQMGVYVYHYVVSDKHDLEYEYSGSVMLYK